MPGRAPVFRRPPGHLSSKTAEYPLVLFTLYPLTNDTRTIQGGTRSFAPCYVSEAVPGQETAKSLYVYLPAESECIYYPKDKTFPLWRQDADPRQMRCVIAPAHPEDQCRRLFYNQVGCAPIIKSRAITLNMAISLSAPIRRKFAPAAMFLVCRHPFPVCDGKSVYRAFVGHCAAP